VTSWGDVIAGSWWSGAPRVLDAAYAAYAATPERFVRRPPTPPALPTAAWINKPNTEEVAH
jgi:hypothetical protein